MTTPPIKDYIVQEPSYFRHEDPKSTTHLGRVWSEYGKINEMQPTRYAGVNTALQVATYAVTSPFAFISMMFTTLGDGAIYVGNHTKKAASWSYNKITSTNLKASKAKESTQTPSKIKRLAMGALLTATIFTPLSIGTHYLFQTIGPVPKVDSVNSESLDATDIQRAICPVKEYVEQFNELIGVPLNERIGVPLLSPFSIKAVYYTLIVIVTPILEELQFRRLIQDVLLKRMPQYVVSKISPKNAAFFDSVTAKVMRVVSTSLLFSLMHLANRSVFGDSYVTMQLIQGFILGIGFGTLKESKYGLLGAIGGHTIHNSVTTLPLLLSC